LLEVADGRIDQNPEMGLNQEDMKQSRVLFRIGPKDRPTAHWVLEVLPSVLIKMDGKKVFLGMTRCNV